MTNKQSREIKFRLWLGGRFFYWGFLGGSFVGLPMSTEEDITMEEKEKRSQQFTGLLDRTGKEIYEGDIVRCKCKGRGGEPVGEMRWYEDYGCWGIHQPGDWDCDKGKPLGSSGSSTPYRNYSFKSFTSFEIIGNRHENPELLTPNHLHAGIVGVGCII